ncbi:hypothetical protein QUA35_23535 [Microcoleus sp. N9_B2]|uniref:hypothetical protein n=1 Tax=unclassified Microcoleus TaxID=2642155 RepID=UPI002FCEC953
MRLKSWESPRSEGRNSKGKGGSARARQLKKQQQTLRKQLKAQHDRQNTNKTTNKTIKGRKPIIPSLFLYLSATQSR